MWHSIQENLKKINSYLSWGDCFSLFITTLFLGTFLTFIYLEKADSYIPVRYIESNGEILSKNNISKPFASRSGKTYTFSWCQGSTIISEKNKIYFSTEDEAINSGRVLSKLCQK